MIVNNLYGLACFIVFGYNKNIFEIFEQLKNNQNNMKN